MNWFKHYVNASDDIRVFRLKDEMGYTGLGIYWTIMEMMARGGGCYVRVGLTALKNRRTPKERIDRVLDGFGLFHTDADGRVTIVPPAADERPTSGITLPKARQINTSESTDNKGDNSVFLAPAHVNKKREEKKREEENPSNTPVEVAQSATSDELRATSDEFFYLSLVARHCSLKYLRASSIMVSNPRAMSSEVISTRMSGAMPNSSCSISGP